MAKDEVKFTVRRDADGAVVRVDDLVEWLLEQKERFVYNYSADDEFEAVVDEIRAMADDS